tara:strand:- start:27 stop:170 length:144 start_codon:yes stop_codon:yes gene_type:complete
MFKFIIIEHYLSILRGFYKNMGRLWRVSYCEELGGGYLQEMMGFVSV